MRFFLKKIWERNCFVRRGCVCVWIRHCIQVCEFWCWLAAKNCICRMLKVDPAHRISAAEVLNHSWITVSNTWFLLPLPWCPSTELFYSLTIYPVSLLLKDDPAYKTVLNCTCHCRCSYCWMQMSLLLKNTKPKTSQYTVWNFDIPIMSPLMLMSCD